jgi:hypothetical protein
MLEMPSIAVSQIIQGFIVVVKYYKRIPLFIRYLTSLGGYKE